MTPLALRLAEQFLGTSTNSFEVSDPLNVGAILPKGHCFETSAIEELIIREDLSGNWQKPDLWFLPSPITWIESKINTVSVSGILLRQKDSYITAYRCRISKFEKKAKWGKFQFSLESPDIEKLIVRHILLSLQFINNPRLIGRIQRTEKPENTSEGGAGGYYPHGAWTEIRLKADELIDASNEPSAEARCTGHRVRHFCRAHLRVRDGKVEFVKAHWRGDASRGTKNSRYKITAKSQGEKQ